MKSIKQTYFIKTSLTKFWKALVNPKYIEEWGGGPVNMSDKAGSKFTLWGGSIWGENITVLPEKKLVQEWYSESEHGKWKKPSIATFILKEEKDGIRIDFLHTDVPDADIADITDGWKDYYLGPLKEYLEKKNKS